MLRALAILVNMDGECFVPTRPHTEDDNSGRSFFKVVKTTSVQLGDPLAVM